MCSPDYSEPGTSGSSPDSSAPTTDYPGFPTYAQYKTIEAAHLASLSSAARQEKSLISQSVFDRIWDVLIEQEQRKETAQFRHWARKNFALGEPPSPDLPCPTGVALLHKGLLVAVQEQLYALLCYYHGKAEHSGHDRTSQLLRKDYNHVPKPLLKGFVKACPCPRSKPVKRPRPVSLLYPVSAICDKENDPNLSSHPLSDSGVLFQNNYHTMASQTALHSDFSELGPSSASSLSNMTSFFNGVPSSSPSNTSAQPDPALFQDNYHAILALQNAIQFSESDSSSSGASHSSVASFLDVSSAASLGSIALSGSSMATHTDAYPAQQHLYLPAEEESWERFLVDADDFDAHPVPEFSVTRVRAHPYKAAAELRGHHAALGSLSSLEGF